MALPQSYTVVATATSAGTAFAGTTPTAILPAGAVYTFPSTPVFTYAGQRFKLTASGIATFPSGHTDYSANIYTQFTPGSGSNVLFGNLSLLSNNVVAPPASTTVISAFGQAGQQLNLTVSTPASPLSWTYELWGTIVTIGASGTFSWSARLMSTMYLNSERVKLSSAQWTVVSSGNTASINTTVTNALNLYGSWSSIVAGPSATLEDFDLMYTP